MSVRIVAYLLLVCTFLFCSCADAVEDGVLIVPSSRNSYEDASAVITAAASEETVSLAEALVTEETREAESVTDDTARIPDGFDAAEQARLLFEDEAFLALLAQFELQLDAQTAVAAAVLAYQQSKGTVTEFPSPEDTVFWTAGGSVWHVTAECSALAKSKSVVSGSEDQALQAGKTRVCKRCGE